MQLTYRGASYSPASTSEASTFAQSGAGAVGTYRGTKVMLGAGVPAQPFSARLCYRGISYVSAE